MNRKANEGIAYKIQNDLFPILALGANPGMVSTLVAQKLGVKPENIIDSDLFLYNRMLRFFRLPTHNWLGDPHLALGTIALVTVWQFGSSMLLFLAGLKQIPECLYEAAELDGSGKLRTFFAITLPELSPIVLFNLIMQMINAFQEFTAAYVITQGGPLKSTYLYGMMLYEQGFKYFKMGYASALSWILFAIILGFTALTFKSSQSWVHYGDSV